MHASKMQGRPMGGAEIAIQIDYDDGDASAVINWPFENMACLAWPAS